MKVFISYIVVGAVAINVVGNVFANSAEGIKAAHTARTDRLCMANRDYC